MASFTLADLEQNNLTPDVAENSKPNAFVSALAGIGSGLFKIPEGFVSLGATLIDLGADTNKAAEVEKFFAKINPFDEYAEATTAGKITELIVNIGVPAGMAFKVGTGLAKGALIAKRKDQYLDLGGDMSKAIQKKLKGTKLTRPETRLVDEAFSKTGTGLDKTIAYGTGAGLGGLAEGLFIDDVSEAGSFGDLVGGPTALDRDKKNPETELLNRLRFGIEGVAFTGLLGAAGKTISRIRNQTGTGKAITGKFNQWTDKYLSQPIRSRGAKPQIGFEIEKTMEGRIARDTNVTENAMERINKIAGNIQDKTKKTYGNKTSNRTREKLDEKLNNFLMSDKYLTPNIKQVEEISGNELKKTFVFDIRKIPKTDPITSLPYRVGVGQFKDLKPGAQLPDKAKVLDKKTGKFIKDDLGNDVLEDTMSAEEVVNVQFNKPTEKALKDFKTDFKKTFKATDQELDSIIDEYDRVRGNVEELLTVYASRLTPDALQEFGTMMRNSFKDAFDRGYDVFKNNKGDLKLAKNYRPTQKVLEETAESFVNDVATKSKGKLKLTKQEAMTMADEIWDGTELAKGVLLGQGTRAAGQVFLKSVPDFYVKSVADTLANTKKQIVGQSDKLLKDLTPEGQKVIKNLLGKTKNPMSTLVEGTANLSSQVRFNQYLDDLAKENSRRTNTWNRWNDGYTEINPRTGDEITVAPKTGPEPPIPFLFNNTGLGRKIAGGDSRNYQQILGTAARADQGTALGKFSDPLATLKPLDETERAAQIIKQQDAKLQALENARLKAAEKGET